MISSAAEPFSAFTRTRNFLFASTKVRLFSDTAKHFQLIFVNIFHYFTFLRFQARKAPFSASRVSSLRTPTFKPANPHFQACKICVSGARRQRALYMTEIVNIYYSVSSSPPALIYHKSQYHSFIEDILKPRI